MAISNYGELKTAVSNWLDREDLTLRIPEFVTLAETRINEELRTRENEKRITASISTEYFDIPTNFIEMRNFQLNTDPIQHMEYYSPEQMDQYRPDSTGGQPRIYSIHGTEFQVKPIPDTTYTSEMTYWYRLATFDTNNDTNTVLQKFPGLYLYASLIAAAPFLESNQNLTAWHSMYTELLEKINDNDMIGRFSGTRIYSRPRHRPE